MKKLVIAIDGPAASGKSTTSRLVAERLGYLYVDTGAMYRAITWKVIRNKINPEEANKIGELAERTSVRLEKANESIKVFLDGEDVSKTIRTLAVTRAVSAVSALEKVRTVMVREQRKIGENGGVVVDGRDIGTVVFPSADVKIFMIADVEERARRRQKELEQTGINVSLSELIEEIATRDKKDSGREISPLRKADDAITLDTTDMTIDEQVDFIVKKVFEKLG